MAAEMLLQYMWEHRLWPYGTFVTTDGRRIEVLDPGRRNTDAGPDFFNAKLRIGCDMWAGNVEIHDRASDWMRHGHQNDCAYDTVILHVVGESDCAIHRPDGNVIPQAVLPYTPEFRERYMAMVDNPATPACGAELAHIPPLLMTDWLGALGYERLYAKVERIEAALARLDGDWQAASYVTLARALGFSTNSEPFERLAFATPLRCLLKHRSDPALIEATLFGQAGFLDSPGHGDEYMQRLRMDYGFMRAKYDLVQVEAPGWKTARMRPPNMPHRRIAALAAMIADGFAFGRAFVHIDSEKAARSLLAIEIGGYWATHYTFGGKLAMAPRVFSTDSVSSLIINAVVPLLYAYGLYFADDRKTAAAVDILQHIRPENNCLTRIFTDYGIPCDDAFTSQAMIQLRRAYCEKRKCLYCRIGHRILAAKARP